MVVTWQVQQIRVTTARPLREFHAARFESDRAGLTAVALARSQRHSWAKGEWMSLLHSAATELTSAHHCLSCANEVDEFLVSAVEGIVRVFCGLVARNFVLWQGGIWCFATLLDSPPDERISFCSRRAKLWQNFLRIDALLNDPTYDIAAKAPLNTIAQECIWKDHRLHRLFHSLAAAGRVDDATALAMRVFGGLPHEKGSLVVAVNSDSASSYATCTSCEIKVSLA